jgi:hypothetical protein
MFCDMDHLLEFCNHGDGADEVGLYQNEEADAWGAL